MKRLTTTEIREKFWAQYLRFSGDVSYLANTKRPTQAEVVFVLKWRLKELTAPLAKLWKRARK